MKNDKIEVSTKHIVLRTVLFAIAFVLAISAFGFGISQLGHKDPGYYEIQAKASEDAPTYGSEVTFLYRFTGSSDEIRAKNDAITALYSETLLRYYKLLDREHTYEGFVNLASVNASPGQTLTVSRELADILKTGLSGDYCLFSGAMNDEWRQILYLAEPQDFDPLNNEDIRSRIEALATWKPEDYVELKVSGEQVTLKVDPEYLAFLQENEYSTDVLDTGLLREALLLSAVRDALEAAGYTDGYLCTDMLTVTLSGHSGTRYVLYGLDPEKQVQRIAYAPAKGGSVNVYLRVFAMQAGELGYYTAGDVYRNPYFVQETGGHTGVLECACVLREDGDILQATCEAIRLFRAPDREAVMAALEASRTPTAVRFPGETGYQTNAPEQFLPEKGK